jgi:hypothetical protein
VQRGRTEGSPYRKPCRYGNPPHRLSILSAARRKSCIAVLCARCAGAQPRDRCELAIFRSWCVYHITVCLYSITIRKKWITWSGYAMRETVEGSNGRVGMSGVQRSLLLSNDAPHQASPISAPFFLDTWESKRLTLRFHAEKRQVRWANNLQQPSEALSPCGRQRLLRHLRLGTSSNHQRPMLPSISLSRTVALLMICEPLCHVVHGLRMLSLEFGFHLTQQPIN